MIRARVQATGKTISRYVLDLALADDPDVHPLVLKEDSQLSLLGGMLDIRELVHAIWDELSGGGGQTLLSAIVLMNRERVARSPPATCRSRRRTRSGASCATTPLGRD